FGRRRRVSSSAVLIVSLLSEGRAVIGARCGFGQVWSIRFSARAVHGPPTRPTARPRTGPGRATARPRGGNVALRATARPPTDHRPTAAARARTLSVSSAGSRRLPDAVQPPGVAAVQLHDVDPVAAQRPC